MQAVLTRLGAWTAQQLQTVPAAHKVLVSEHRAFSTFASRYGIRELPVIDTFATGGTLRPSSLAAISEAIRKSGTGRADVASVARHFFSNADCFFSDWGDSFSGKFAAINLYGCRFSVS